MAYNYFPATYQPYQPNYYGYQQMPQQIPQQMPQAQTQLQGTQMSLPNQQQTTTPIQSGILWVTSEQEAQAYPVAPNNAVALWDSSAPSVYIKQADASGKPVLKIYDLTERTETPRVAPKAQGDIDALRSDVKAEVEKLWAAVDDIRAKAETPRRTQRKREVIDDDE